MSSSVLSTLREDLDLGPRGIFRLFTVRSLAVVLVRVATAAGGVHPLLGLLVKQVNHVLTGADIAWQAELGPGLRLYHPTGVVVGPYVRVGRNCRLQQGVTLGGFGGDAEAEDTSPVIGDDVELGSGAKVIGPIMVGDRCRVGANAVVTRSVPADHVAVGVPARSRPVGGSGGGDPTAEGDVEGDVAAGAAVSTQA